MEWRHNSGGRFASPGRFAPPHPTNSHSFHSVLDDCCKESEEIHVEEEEEEGESEVGGIENNELLDFLYI